MVFGHETSISSPYIVQNTTLISSTGAENRAAFSNMIIYGAHVFRKKKNRDTTNMYATWFSEEAIIRVGNVALSMCSNNT